MQFNEIPHHLLKPNEKYKISNRDQVFTATFNKYREYNLLEFIKIKQGEFCFGPACFWEGNIYYQPIFQKEKIQQNMECRALHLILRKITGDQCFEWYPREFYSLSL